MRVYGMGDGLSGALTWRERAEGKVERGWECRGEMQFTWLAEGRGGDACELHWRP